MKISEFKVELESEEYAACRFKLDRLVIISRNSKITPKKVGQFVTFWKRNASHVTEPFDESYSFDFYVINARKDNRLGQFVFPKSILISKGIIRTEKKDGKRGFRVYPSWDVAQNKQAIFTQKWQLEYFYEVGIESLDFIANLYSK
tara:strand:- start:104 stop:541 length:438 start_codon:yes stop_codon:yes gene_type:complete